MSNPYQDLSSSNESNVFDINNDQTHFFNHFIHFATKTLNEQQMWHECRISHVFNEKQNSVLPIFPGKTANLNFQITALNMSTIFVTLWNATPEEVNPHTKSKRTIDYTQTFFQTLWPVHWCFSGPNLLTNTLLETLLLNINIPLLINNQTFTNHILSFPWNQIFQCFTMLYHCLQVNWLHL